MSDSAAPVRWLGWMGQGETYMLGSLAGLGDEAFAGPSLLPGWSRAHVLAHLARNADALCNLLSWARTGVETSMYSSPEQRWRDIETSARQAPPALRADVASATHRLLEAAEATQGCWHAEVRTALGRTVPASELPWLRLREAWIHTVDLDAGASFADQPPEVVGALLAAIASSFVDRDDCPRMTLRATDAPTSWTIGGSVDVDTTEVVGSSSALLGWLLGRTSGADLETDHPSCRLDAPPAWL